VPIPDPPENELTGRSRKPFGDAEDEVFSSGIQSPEEILGTAVDGDGFSIDEDEFL
jgi:hypothetical protein